MSITKFVISKIHPKYTVEYIANVLWRQNIAQVNSITLLSTSKYTQTAFVDVATWCDSEVAYNFIHRLKNNTKDVRIVHDNDFWWNAHAISFSGSLSLGFHTTLFSESYFVRSENLDVKEEKEEDEDDKICQLEKEINRCIFLNRRITDSSMWSHTRQYTDNILEFCSLEEKLREYGANHTDDPKIVEKLKKYFGLKDGDDPNNSGSDIKTRLEFLKRMKLGNYYILDPKAKQRACEIQDEIDYLERQLLVVQDKCVVLS